MARGIPLRKDYDGDALRVLARKTVDGKQARRLLALSMIYDGEARQIAARHADVTLQTIRDWVLWFNAEGPQGLLDGKSTGFAAEAGYVAKGGFGPGGRGRSEALS